MASSADITAASQAQEAGEDRNIMLVRSVVRVSQERVADLRATVEEFLRDAQDQPAPGGARTTIVWVAVDCERRSAEDWEER